MPKASVTSIQAPPVPPAKPKRFTATDMVDRLLASMNRVHGDHSSITLSRNARGNTQIEVVVRTGEHDIDSIDKCRTEAQRIFNLLSATYPMLPEEPKK